ncbi:MAG: hypothetical protein WC914_05960 [Proteiniphilum sp.]
MNRRNFLSRTTAGVAAILVAPGLWRISSPEPKEKSFSFMPYRKGETLVPVWQITPDDGYYIHSFYDICPWSPDSRFLLVNKLPYQEKKPRRGDEAEICVIDISRQTIRTIYRTKVWSFQVGANAQWDSISNKYVYTNDIINGLAVCVRIDIITNEIVAYTGPKYDISPDGKLAAGPNLDYINITQYGYSLPDPESEIPNQYRKDQMDSEGLWITNLETNSTRLLASYNEIYRHAVESDKQFYKEGTYYGFHTKFNPRGNRIMFVFRCLFEGKGRNASLFTLRPDGSEITQCLPREKWNQKAELGGSGNHPNWHPDGEHIIMNTVPTWLGYKNMMFSIFKHDGSNFRVLTGKFLGSGHPSIDSSGRYIISDAYVKQSWVVKNNEIPLRFIDLKEEREHTLCTVSNNVGNEGNMYSDEGGSQFKLDPHPAWSRDYKKVCFNGAPDGKRQVFVADIKSLVE